MKPLMLTASLIIASLSAPATGQPATSEESAPAAATKASVQPQVAAALRARKSPMLSDAELDTQRGGESLVITNQTMTAITSGNILNGDYAAGNVSLSDFALSNFNGVGNLLINTGAQVSAQSGMNLTINLGN